ncbi:MAG: class I SAM-dependent methyltransferase [Acidobacteriaceae bacterium]|nr:class I SAM-dependent methyltransferase [Acidobacteriaceae bacterium]
MVYLFVKQQLSRLHERLSVLHIAPEPHIRALLSSHRNIRYLSGDIEAAADVRFDLVCAPFRDQTFDAVICNHVLEHIPNDAAAMREIYRVLKPTGWAVLQVPLSLVLWTTLEDFSVISPDERERVFGQHDHVRIYSPGDYKSRLEAAGFRVEVHRSREIGGRAALKFGLAAEESLYCARKI